MVSRGWALKEKLLLQKNASGLEELELHVQGECCV